MNSLAAGVSYLDLSFQGTPRIIATAVLQGPGGVALIDPGPSSTLPTLRRELSPVWYWIHPGVSTRFCRPASAPYPDRTGRKIGSDGAAGSLDTGFPFAIGWREG